MTGSLMKSLSKNDPDANSIHNTEPVHDNNRLYLLPKLKRNTDNTVWKFHEFSTTQILREINFGDSRSAKSAILIHREALNFDFKIFLPFLMAVKSE